jgi:hypothetical protein
MDQSVMVFDDAAARTAAIPSPSEGMVTYLKDTDSLWRYITSWVQFAPITQTMLPAGSVLKVASEVDTSNRSTGSTSFVDGSLSISFTPLSASSTLYVYHYANVSSSSGAFDSAGEAQITNASNVALPGAEAQRWYNRADPSDSARIQQVPYVALGVTPAVNTSARTYKVRFRSVTGTASLNNASNTGRLLVTEIAG